MSPFYLKEIKVQYISPVGSTKFYDSITTQLEECESKLIFDHFQAMPGNFLNINATKLSTDQKYLLGMLRAVSIHIPFISNQKTGLFLVN